MAPSTGLPANIKVDINVGRAPKRYPARPNPVTEIDCGELSSDEQLALAAHLNEALQGRAISLVKGDRIVFDNLSGDSTDCDTVEAAVKEFVSRRRDAEHFLVERRDDTLVVRSPDPIAASHRSRPKGLPPNIFACPFCPFVTPYQELYVVHYRSHGFT